jgi:hypothetical protein
MKAGVKQAAEKSLQPVILSEAKNLSSLQNQATTEILRRLRLLRYDFISGPGLKWQVGRDKLWAGFEGIGSSCLVLSLEFLCRRIDHNEQIRNKVSNFGNHPLGGGPDYGCWPPSQFGKTRH